MLDTKKLMGEIDDFFDSADQEEIDLLLKRAGYDENTTKEQVRESEKVLHYSFGIALLHKYGYKRLNAAMTFLDSVACTIEEGSELLSRDETLKSIKADYEKASADAEGSHIYDPL